MKNTFVNLIAIFSSFNIPSSLLYSSCCSAIWDVSLSRLAASNANHVPWYKIDSSETESSDADVTTKADDFKKVEGIGPKIAEALNAAGINTFGDLADKTSEEIKSILEASGGSLKSKNPDSWPKQAKFAADGNWDELKKWQEENDNGIEK